MTTELFNWIITILGVVMGALLIGFIKAVKTNEIKIIKLDDKIFDIEANGKKDILHLQEMMNLKLDNMNEKFDNQSLMFKQMLETVAHIDKNQANLRQFFDKYMDMEDKLRSFQK